MFQPLSTIPAAEVEPARPCGHWILSDQVISGKRQFLFREDSPKEILDLYENIKSKLDFVYQEVRSNNNYELEKHEK